MPTPREPIHRFPEWAEAILADGYTVKPEDRRIKSDLDLTSQFRVEFDTDETTVNCAMFLDSLQANWFEAFERDVLRQGSRWFLMNLWMGGQMAEHRVRFKERPKLSGRIGEEWAEYSFALEIWKRQGLKPAAAPRDEKSALPKWPGDMPAPLVDGYGIEPQDRRVKADYEAGSSFRVVFDTDETTASCSLILEPEQANWFEAFERDVLVQGSKWFIMPLWIGGQMVDSRVRFESRPELSEKSGIYSAYTFSLNVAKREGLMDKDLTEFLLDFDPYLFMDLEDKLQIIVNVRFPRALPFGREY